jgi:hypothetical protein
MKLIYTDNHAIADHLSNSWFEKIKDQKEVSFSNSIQLLKIRVEHIKKNITVESIDLHGEIVHLDDKGTLDYCPEGFFDNSFDLVIEIEELLK